MEIERLSRLTEDLLALSRADAGRFELHPTFCDLAEIARQSLRACAARAEHAGVPLRQEGAPSLPVQGDRDRLRQVADNLLDNALQHAPAGSVVRVVVEARAGMHCLRVQDFGEGLSAEDQTHIFERFYRVDRSRARRSGGSGLGLAIVQAMVEAHGGRVAVDSEPGAGATFSVCLPPGKPGRAVKLDA